MSSLFLKFFGEKRFAYSVKVFPATIKSIKPIQKYPHIIESDTCTLKIIVVILLLLLLLLLLLFCTHKATQWVPISEYSSRFIT